MNRTILGPQFSTWDFTTFHNFIAGTTIVTIVTIVTKSEGKVPDRTPPQGYCLYGMDFKAFGRQEAQAKARTCAEKCRIYDWVAMSGLSMFIIHILYIITYVSTVSIYICYVYIYILNNVYIYMYVNIYIYVCTHIITYIYIHMHFNYTYFMTWSLWRMTGSLWPGGLPGLLGGRPCGGTGKHTKNDGKSPCFMGKSTISMTIFNGFLYVYQRVMWDMWEWFKW